MQIRRNPPGSLIKQSLFFSDREIDSMCSKALKDGGFLPNEPSPINIEGFVENFFDASIDYGTEPDEGVLGWTFFGPQGQILLVGVSPKLSNDTSLVGERRLRATLAHEAGHCLMHPILFMEDGTESFAGNVDFQNRRILCRKEDFGPKYDGRWWEVQANKAIGGLLLPKKLVNACVEPLLSEQGSLGLMSLSSRNREEATELVADAFEVNRTPAAIRLEQIFPSGDQEFL